MKRTRYSLRNHAKTAAVVALVACAYWFARLPELSGSEREQLASHFKFAKQALPEPRGYPQHFVRSVAPSLKGIAAWISSVGAGVALNDLDGNGLADDVCYTDPRTDRVIIAPVPGTGTRYGLFTLDPAPLPYDAATTAPMGCLPGDFNEDGLMDVLVYYWGRAPVLFLRVADEGPNTPPLSASSYRPRELIAAAERWYTNAATQADLDGDGHTDLIFGNYFPDGALILDADADSQEQMQHSMSRARNGGRKRLFLWAGATSGAQPSARFEDASGALSDDLARGWTLAAGAADLDGDLLPEVYFANDFGPDLLLHNLSRPGDLRFEVLHGRQGFATPRSKVLGKDSFKGMGVDFADLNGDGLLDIYVSNIAAEYALEESHFAFVSTGRLDLMKQQVAPYVESSEALGLSRSGWGWDTRFGDFNNDGVVEALQAVGFMKGTVSRWPELHELAMGNDQLLEKPQVWPRFQPGDDLSGHLHNPFFVRASDQRFYDLAQEIGLAESHVSRGIATADVDGDGRLDFAVANQWETSYFYHNESPDAGGFLGLRLRLPVDRQEPATFAVAEGATARLEGRPAIGACATVYLPDGRRLMCEVDGGNGHSGKRSPDLHFGLGGVAPNTELRVDLRWRAAGQVFERTLYLSPGWHAVLLGQ